jgi:hypothetical protein
MYRPWSQIQKSVFKIFLVLFLFLSFEKPAWSAVTVFSRSGDIWLGNKLVLRVHSRNSGHLVVNRLKQALLYGINARQVWIDRFGKNYILYAKTIPVITATPQLAHLNHTSPFWLARIWASRLKLALIHGTYLITPSSLVIPYQQTKQFQVMGHYSGNLSIKIEDSKIVSLQNKQFPFILKGLKPGKTQVRITADHLSVLINLYVKEWSGFIPGKISLLLTGKKIPHEYLERRALQQIASFIPRKPDTRISAILPRALISESLRSGETSVFPVKVSIHGSGYLPVKGMLDFEIKDLPFHLYEADSLMVSNNPEGFNRSGILFKKSFETGTARFFFHHKNKGENSYRFIVLVKNQKNKLLRIQISGGGAGPALSEIDVGEKAAYRFFSCYRDDLGEIMQLEPGESAILFAKAVPPQQTVSGIYQITPLNHNADYQVETVVQKKDGTFHNTILPPEIKAEKSNGTFPNPTIYMKAKYIIGKHYAFIPIGKKLSLSDPNSGKPDFGDYGALYKIHVSIINPSSNRERSEIMFFPQGGPARGVFVIDHEIMMETPVVQPFNDYPLVTLNLKPLQTEKIEVETIPEGGSSYPVDLVVKP